jgi:hypothetical protein
MSTKQESGAVAAQAGTLRHGEIGLLGVLMPGLAQVAPAFNLFFTAGVMAGLAGASVPLVFLISLLRGARLRRLRGGRPAGRGDPQPAA